MATTMTATDSITPETPGSTVLDTPRPKTAASRSLTPAEKAEKEATFTPNMISSPDLREKAKSSGYGKAIPVKAPAEIVPSDLELEEEKQLTFVPNMGATQKKRAAVTSSGYGKAVPAKKSVEQETPTFQPDTSATKNKTKKVASNGYGKSLPVKKTSGLDEHAPSFSPKTDFGKKGQKLRKAAQSRILEPARPRTAPSSTGKVRTPLRYTLAAPAAQGPVPEPEEPSTFDLSGLNMVGQQAPHLTESQLHKMPPPVEPTRFGAKLKKNATPTGYGTGWVPPVVLHTSHESQPVIHAGIASSSYIASPGELPVVQSKTFKNVLPTYNADYEVAKGEKPEPKEPGLKAFSTPMSAAIPAIEELEIVDNSSKNKYTVSTYVQGDYEPLKADLPAPKQKNGGFSPPFVSSSKSDEIPQLDEIAPVRNYLDETASSGYGIVSTHAPDYNPRSNYDVEYEEFEEDEEAARKVPPPVAPKPGAAPAEEQTTVL